MEPSNARPDWARLLGSPVGGQVFLGAIFLLIGAIFVRFGITTTHDAIGQYGFFHFFCDSIARGTVPFWNPYSQTGTPFYPSWQIIGFQEPSLYLFILIKKMTGCGTLPIFICHYLFQYFVFVSGAYHVFRVVTRDNETSLLFACVLLLGSFPPVMHQFVTLIPFFLLPFATYAFLRFFEETPEHQGPLFFAGVTLCALSALSYIPSYALFYLLSFWTFAFAMGIARFDHFSRMLRARRGVLWAAAAAGIALLVIAPVVALYLDMRAGDELFPSFRLLSAHDLQIPIVFASDVARNVFSKSTMYWVSITLGNVIGLLFQPARSLWGIDLWKSEVHLYVGILPLLCALFFISRRRRLENKQALLLLGMCAVTFLTMCSFKGEHDQGAVQKLLVAVVPGLDKVEVFEGFGVIFLFLLLSGSAAGFSSARRAAGISWWQVAAAATGAKLVFQSCRIPGSLLMAVPFAIGGFIFIASGTGKRTHAGIRRLCLALLFADLFWFDFVHIRDISAQVGESAAVETTFYKSLMQANLLTGRREESFIDYRQALSDSCIFTLFGYEMLTVDKVAVPALFNRFRSGCVTIDHLFSTQRYYDYLVHVDLAKQSVTSNIITPILNFYPVRDVVSVADERAAIDALNHESLRGLADHIFIETDGPGAPPAHAPTGPLNFLTPSPEQMIALTRPGRRVVPRAGFQSRILKYDANRLSVEVSAPQDGYFYFGDGYSKHWKAAVDGRSAKILKTNVNFKSVFVSRGSHRVDFVYDPVLVRYGMLIGIVGDALAFVFMIVSIACAI